MKPQILILVLGCMLIFDSGTTLAEDTDPVFTLSAGMEVTSGDYGGVHDIEDIYTPFTATVDYGRMALRLTVPYLNVRAPEGTIITGPGGEPIPGEGPMTTNSGIGDVIAGITLYDVLSNRRLGFAMDLSAKVKLGTADETKGLGTGENDYTVQANFLKFLDKITLIGSVGYKFRGDPVGIDLDDVLLVSAGGTYKLSERTKSGLFLDYRESSIIGGDSGQELTGFVSHRVSDNWRFQVYLLTGFTDSSPDFGGGFLLKRSL